MPYMQNKDNSFTYYRTYFSAIRRNNTDLLAYLWRRVHDGWLGMHVQQGGGPCCWSVQGRDSRGGHEAVSMVRRCHVSGSEVRVDVNLLGFRGWWWWALQWDQNKSYIIFLFKNILAKLTTTESKQKLAPLDRYLKRWFERAYKGSNL